MCFYKICAFFAYRGYKKKTVFDRVPQFEGKVQNYPQFLFKVMIEDEIWLFRNQS